MLDVSVAHRVADSMSRHSSFSSAVSASGLRSRFEVKEQQSSSSRNNIAPPTAAKGCKGQQPGNQPKSVQSPFLNAIGNLKSGSKLVKRKSKKDEDDDDTITSRLQKFNNLACKEEKTVSLLSASADPVQTIGPVLYKLRLVSDF